MNGIPWSIRYVDPWDPVLVDRTGTATVATTDPGSLTVYVSDDLGGPFLERVVLHELGHCALFSYGLVDQLHDMTYPDRWVDAEEWACNLIADYGMRIFEAAGSLIGAGGALTVVPREIERLVA